MIRKQVYITPRHEALLKRRARELGVSEAELIRQGIENAGHGYVAKGYDAQAWNEVRSFMRHRQRLNVPQTERSWKRDELYEERLGKRPH
jgi:hypothetical protein